VQDGDPVLDGVAQHSEQALVFRVIVRVVAEVFAELGDLFAVRVVDDSSVSSSAGIVTGSAVDVGGVGGNRGSRDRKKIAGVGRARRHEVSLQLGRGSHPGTPETLRAFYSHAVVKVGTL
jgi:hypothetical protein